MFSKSASHKTNTPPKLELITGGLASQPADKPEVSAFAACIEAINPESAPISPETIRVVMTTLSNVMQGTEGVLTAVGKNLSTFKSLVDCVGKRAREIAKKETIMNVAMHALEQGQPAVVAIGDQLHMVVNPSKLAECANQLAKALRLPCFYSPGIGLVEVDEEPLFGGWRCSPVPVAELTKALRAKVHLHWLQGWSEGESASELDLYNIFAKELAGTRSFNAYFPELNGLVFAGHTTSDGRQLKRTGYDRGTGLFVMAKHAFDFPTSYELMADAA